MNFPWPSTQIFGETFLRVKLLSTFAGDIIDIQDLIVSTAAGPAVRNSKAQTAAATIVNSTRIGTYKKRQRGIEKIIPIFYFEEGMNK